ncbi:MAG: transposase [Symploca sp. SIO2G7]|nr:transposase [Symploca sp. SIO2G7]
MPNYRRAKFPGGTYFLTQVTHERQPWLISAIGREALRTAIVQVRQKYPFTIDAFVLLPEHFHCLWTLPEGDNDFSTRLRLIKTVVTKKFGQQLSIKAQLSVSRQKRKEGNLWQRRFWEHLIRDEEDFIKHCDYIHYNPVKHKLCLTPQDWQFSSIHRLTAQGIYPPNWGSNRIPEVPESIWDI